MSCWAACAPGRWLAVCEQCCAQGGVPLSRQSCVPAPAAYWLCALGRSQHADRPGAERGREAVCSLQRRRARTKLSRGLVSCWAACAPGRWLAVCEQCCAQGGVPLSRQSCVPAPAAYWLCAVGCSQHADQAGAERGREAVRGQGGRSPAQPELGTVPALTEVLPGLGHVQAAMLVLRRLTCCLL